MEERRLEILDHTVCFKYGKLIVSNCKIVSFRTKAYGFNCLACLESGQSLQFAIVDQVDSAFFPP